MSAEHAIKVFGETDQQVAGANGAIKMNPVMHGGRRRKTNKTRGGRKNKNNKSNKNKNNKSNKNRKTMRGGK
jgi:hypothetical protein